MDLNCMNREQSYERPRDGAITALIQRLKDKYAHYGCETSLSQIFRTREPLGPDRTPKASSAFNLLLKQCTGQHDEISITQF